VEKEPDLVVMGLSKTALWQSEEIVTEVSLALKIALPSEALTTLNSSRVDPPAERDVADKFTWPD
jgi:hypothetical protein